MTKLKKILPLGKVNFILILIYLFFVNLSSPLNALENILNNFIEIKILDKVSSKTNPLKLKIGEEVKISKFVN